MITWSIPGLALMGRKTPKRQVQPSSPTEIKTLMTRRQVQNNPTVKIPTLLSCHVMLIAFPQGANHYSTNFSVSRMFRMFSYVFFHRLRSFVTCIIVSTSRNFVSAKREPGVNGLSVGDNSRRYRLTTCSTSNWSI